MARLSATPLGDEFEGGRTTIKPPHNAQSSSLPLLPLSFPHRVSSYVGQVVSPGANAEYVARLHKGQAACIQRLQRLADGNVGGEEGGGEKLDVSPVPFFDMEVAGVYPLRCGDSVTWCRA